MKRVGSQLRATLDQLRRRANHPGREPADRASCPGCPEVGARCWFPWDRTRTCGRGEERVECGFSAIVADEEEGVERAVTQDGRGCAGYPGAEV